MQNMEMSIFYVRQILHKMVFICYLFCWQIISFCLRHSFVVPLKCEAIKQLHSSASKQKAMGQMYPAASKHKNVNIKSKKIKYNYTNYNTIICIHLYTSSIFTSEFPENLEELFLQCRYCLTLWERVIMSIESFIMTFCYQ